MKSKTVRSLFLVLLVGSMLFSTVRVSKADYDSSWRGTVTQVYSREYHGLYPLITPDHTGAGYIYSELWRRTLYLDGSGTAQQITTYQVILRNYVWFHINEPTECFSAATYTTRGESTESIFPIIVYVDDAIIDVSYDEHYLPLTTEVDGNECYWLNGSPPVEPQPILWKYDRWYHQGSFSGEDLSIVGRDPYPGFTYET